MFDSLTSRFKSVLSKIGKKPSITEKDLDEILREIRLVLLEADISLPIVKDLIAQLREKLLGQEIYKSISPKAVVSKALYDVLVELLDVSEEDLKLYYKNETAFYMLVGLQGSGKTTTSGKLAYYLKSKLNRKVLLVSLDLNRPAAYAQLQTIAKQNSLDFFEYTNKNLSEIITSVKSYAQTNSYDVVILDTAGRLSIDEELMDEMKYIYNKLTPKEVLLVMDSSSGQMSFSVAKHFSEKIALTGIIASKTDADSRGGAIISCKYITGKPIKFLGVGEKIVNFEIFSANRIVDRILEKGDILSLVEKFEEVEEEEILKLQKRMEKGLFTLEDFKKQMLQMKKLGSVSSMLGMIPGMGAIKDKLSGIDLDKDIKTSISIINSMTKNEKKRPSILNFSRKKRIAQGSGTTLQDINILLKKYETSAKMMKQFKGKNLNSMQDMMANMQPNVKGKKLDMNSIMKIAKKLR